MKRNLAGLLAGWLSAACLCSLIFAQPPAADSGKKTFDPKCAMCHGTDGKGKPAMAKMFKVDAVKLDLTSQEVRKASDEALLKIISAGKDKMPSFSKQLSAEQQKLVVQYIRQISGKGAEAKPAETKMEEKKAPAPAGETKAPEQKSPAAVESAKAPEATAPAAPAVSEEAKKEYAKSCASCHAKDGKGNAAMANVFKVKADALDLVDDATLAKSDEELAKIISDGLNKMPAYKGKISDGTVRDIVAYVRSLKTSK